MAEIVGWVDLTLNHDSLDIEPVDGPAYKSPVFATTQEILDFFDANIATARDVLATSDDKTFAETWTMLRQGDIVFAMPKAAIIRTWVFNHLIHHRAYLCVYLRMNDVFVPGMYGPSSDEAVPT